MSVVETINEQLDFMIDGCKAGLIISNGFINSSGTSPGYMHSHPFYEIHFIVFGENKVRHPKGIIKADTGDIFIFPPGQSHCFIPVANTGEHKRAAFWIEIKIVDAKRKDRFVFDTLYSLKNIAQIKDKFDAFHTVQEIQCELIEKKSCYEENLVHIFAKLIIQICRSIESDSLHTAYTNRTHQSRMLLIEEYIQKNYKDHCTIEGLAEHLHISRRQLTRQIASLFSKSFRQVLLEKRMSMANWLIEIKNISFEAIAEEVGYSSLTAFYHAYKDFYGCTPGEHRKHAETIDI